jgi:coatomer subunit delta
MLVIFVNDMQAGRQVARSNLEDWDLWAWSSWHHQSSRDMGKVRYCPSAFACALGSAMCVTRATCPSCAVLVSRQYVEMNRIRVEGLLAAFPKLVGTGKQYTYVETENVRYVYQPMEGLYLLLITNKQSNILQDLETLRLLSKVVKEYVEEVTEASVCEHSFDLLFAFDEVISLGHKEEVTVAQVRQNTEMESNEEKLINMIRDEKVKQTIEGMKVRVKDIERERIERSRKGGAGGADAFRTSARSSRPEPVGSAALDDAPTFTTSLGVGSSLGSVAPRAGPSKGMKLSKDKRTDLLSALEGEGTSAGATARTLLSAPSETAPAIATDPVNVSIQEKLSVVMNKEGGLQQMEVQGILELLCTHADAACIQVALKSGTNTGFQFKTHPLVDKGLYSSQQRLGVKDPSRPFPVNVPQGALKWRFQTTDEAQVPISVNCWPTPSGLETYLIAEYEAGATYDLQNVEISIPGVTCCWF